MAKKWYERLNPINVIRRARNADRNELEAKSLAANLDAVLGEFRDSIDYSAKFFDEESDNSNAMNMNGIDQMVNATVLAKIYSTETWVYVAVNAIAQAIAGLPIVLQKRQTVPVTVQNVVTGKEESVQQVVWIDASGNPMHDLFEFPNDTTSKSEFLNLILIDLLTAGEYFIYLDSDKDLSPDSEGSALESEPFSRLRHAMASESPVKAMYRIPPALIKPVPAENKSGLAGYHLDTSEGSYAFSAEEIIHVRLPNPMNAMSGLSPLVPSFKQVLIDRFSTEHMIRYYKSGARLGGVIETEKNLNKEQLSRFQRSFENNYTGRQNHHRTLLLPPGMKYNTIEQNPAQTALLDFCKYNREGILAAYRVPAFKAGIIDGSNYANARAQLKSFFKDTIIPMIGFVEDGFNLKEVLLPGKRQFRVKFDLSSVEELQDDGLALANVAKGMLDSGATVNEVRKKVWRLEPIDEGDQSPVIAQIRRDSINSAIGMGQAPQLINGVAQPAPDAAPAEAPADPAQQTIAENQVTDPALSLNGAQVSALLEIIQQVALGLLPRASGIAVICTSFSVDEATAEKIMGDVGKDVPPTEPPTPPPGDAAPVEAPSEEPAAPETVEIVEESKAGEISLDQYLRDRLSSMGDQPITSELVSSIIAEHAAGAKAPEAPTQTVYAGGYTKDTVVNHWKGFQDKTEPMIESRANAVREFFSSMKTIILNRIGANLKAYGMFKSRDTDDIEEILKDGGDIEAALKKYASTVDKSLLEAVQFGFSDTLKNVQLNGLTEENLVASIRKILGAHISGIAETTLDQVRSVLIDKFASGATITDVSKAVREKFQEIDSGRAVTIARTETLTAVSIGRELKREEAKKEFPQRRLMKMWVSAQDERVRDSHATLDGQSVPEGEKFANGLSFPRDPSGEASEVINCRCTDITFFEEQQSDIEDQLPKASENE